MWIKTSYLDHDVLLHPQVPERFAQTGLRVQMHVLLTYLVALTTITNKNADQLFTAYFILFSVTVDQVSLGVLKRLI